MDLGWFIFIVVLFGGIIAIFIKLLSSFFKNDTTALIYVCIFIALFIIMAMMDNFSNLFHLNSDLKNVVGFFKDVFEAIEVPLVLLIVTDKINKSN